MNMDDKNKKIDDKHIDIKLNESLDLHPEIVPGSFEGREVLLESSNGVSDIETWKADELIEIDIVKSDSLIINHITSTNNKKMKRDRDEDVSSPKWKKHKKHIFMVTGAGKPIYSRYGDESKVASIMGAIIGITSVVSRSGDRINYINAGSYKIIFGVFGPINIVTVAKTTETWKLLRRQLEFMHSQFLSLLTNKSHEILFQTPQLDIKNSMLGGTDRIFDSLASEFNYSIPYLLNCVHCLRLSSTFRNVIGNIMQTERENPGIYFAILIANGKLVQLVRPRKYILYPLDLHLLINFVSCSETFRINEASFTPICLPLFDPRGSLHQYVSYLSQNVCLILLGNKPENFMAMGKTKDRIYRALYRVNLIQQIESAAAKQYYNVTELNIEGLLHFVYKLENLSQMTAPAFGPPYNTKKERIRLARLYQHIHSQIHETEKAHRVIFFNSQLESIIGWCGEAFELYATFGPLVSKATAIRGCNAILKWIQQEDPRLFISPSYIW